MNSMNNEAEKIRRQIKRVEERPERDTFDTEIKLYELKRLREKLKIIEGER